MIGLWQHKIKQTDGVFAIMTLAFFLACGLSAMMILWTIAQITAVYNVAYFATQSAATAALETATAKGDSMEVPCYAPDGTSLIDPGSYQCQKNPEVEPWGAAEKALHVALADPRGNFGLYAEPWPGLNNQTGDIELRLVSLSIYNIPPQQGAAGKLRGCKYKAESDAGFINRLDGPGLQLDGLLGCWKTKEKGLQLFPAQHQTGLVLRGSARVPLLPGGFSDAFLPVATTASATITPARALKNYESYQCYGNYRDLGNLYGFNVCDY